MKKRRTVTYKANDAFRRWLDRKTTYRNWHVVEEEDDQQYSVGKGLLLGFLFLPLALFGFQKKLKVTYEQN